MRNGLSAEHRLDQAWQGFDMEKRNPICVCTVLVLVVQFVLVYIRINHIITQNHGSMP